MDIRWKQRFQNFENAYNTFSRALSRYNADPPVSSAMLSRRNNGWPPLNGAI
jgi:hypothetical protein